MAERALVQSLEAKVLETVERTEHLVSLVPADRLSWRPDLPAGLPAMNDIGHLLGHLLDTLSGFCAVLHAAFPEELAELTELRSMKVNQFCEPSEVLEKTKVYEAAIRWGFQVCEDTALARRVKTVFVPEGETLMTLLLGNLEHLINHKYQLFFYLRLAGLPVSSRDLYRWRGESEPGR
jgi:DinB superfamily